MKLNHLDLQVPDVQATVAFLERHFGLEMRTSRHSPAIAILSDGHGFTLVLQRLARPDERHPEGFHIGFLVDNDDEVRDRHARLRSEDVESLSDVIVNNRGVMFYCKAPGDILIEMSCRRR